MYNYRPLLISSACMLITLIQLTLVFTVDCRNNVVADKELTEMFEVAHAENQALHRAKRDTPVFSLNQDASPSKS